jgi:hypothetical protein
MPSATSGEIWTGFTTSFLPFFRSGAGVMAAAANQASTLLFTQIGMGTVRTWPPLPTTLTRRVHRGWTRASDARSGYRLAASTCLRRSLPNARHPLGCESRARRSLPGERRDRLIAFHIKDAQGDTVDSPPISSVDEMHLVVAGDHPDVTIR